MGIDVLRCDPESLLRNELNMGLLVGMLADDIIGISLKLHQVNSFGNKVLAALAS